MCGLHVDGDEIWFDHWRVGKRPANMHETAWGELEDACLALETDLDAEIEKAVAEREKELEAEALASDEERQELEDEKLALARRVQELEAECEKLEQALVDAEKLAPLGKIAILKAKLGARK